MRNGLIDEARGFVDGLAAGDAVVAAAAVGPGQPGADSVPPALAAKDPRRAGGGRGRDRRGGGVRSLPTTGSSSSATLPQGFPSLTWPSPVSDLPLLIAGALGIALVSLTDTISTASAFAARTGQEVDGNGEMIGIGAANIGGGLLPGLSGEHQRLAHRGGRAGRRQDTGHRPRWSSDDRSDAGASCPGCCVTCPSRRSPRW